MYLCLSKGKSYQRFPKCPMSIVYVDVFLQDMFSEELQAVPVELEQMDVTESSRLTEDH